MLPMLAFKDSDVYLDIRDLQHPEVLTILVTALETAPEMIGDRVVVTSCRDGKHSDESLHYCGRAFDLRYSGDRVGGILGHPDATLSVYQKAAAVSWCERMRKVLGPSYDVMFEPNKSHIHIESDPYASLRKAA